MWLRASSNPSSPVGETEALREGAHLPGNRELRAGRMQTFSIPLTPTVPKVGVRLRAWLQKGRWVVLGRLRAKGKGKMREDDITAIPVRGLGCTEKGTKLSLISPL